MFAGIGRGQKITRVTQLVGIPTGSKPLKKSIKDLRDDEELQTRTLFEKCMGRSKSTANGSG
jgi:hypothetical protein